MELVNQEPKDKKVTNNAEPLQQMTTVQTLPEEIILQILSKLPFSSLIRFNCVCKAWKELSQHRYLSHLYNTNNQCLMLYSHDNPSKDWLFFVDFNSNCTDEDTSLKEIRIPFCSSSSALKLKVIGSCNGLLCLSSPDHNDQYIYNPFTSGYTELPKSSHSRVQWAVFGFGFHPKTKEYKVVKFIYDRPSEGLTRLLVPFFVGRSEVHVFTLGSSTCWRSLGKAQHVLKRSTGKNVLVNGRLHFLSALYKYRQDSDILSFDLEDEQFRFIAKPNSIYIGWSDYLLVLKGCLSVASYSYARNEGEIGIWVQKDYDVEASWVKWLNIATQSHVPKALSQEGDNDSVRRWRDHRVLCELKNGEILLEYQSRALVAYDPSNGSFKDVEFQGMPRLFHSVLHLGHLHQIDAIVGSNF